MHVIEQRPILYDNRTTGRVSSTIGPDENRRRLSRADKISASTSAVCFGAGEGPAHLQPLPPPSKLNAFVDGPQSHPKPATCTSVRATERRPHACVSARPRQRSTATAPGPVFFFFFFFSFFFVVSAGLAIRHRAPERADSGDGRAATLTTVTAVPQAAPSVANHAHPIHPDV